MSSQALSSGDLNSRHGDAHGGTYTRAFMTFSNKVARAAGKPVAFAISVATVIVWAVVGPHFHYSDTWQLVINTGTTIITFLMVFLIQSTQNRDGAAIQAKLDELIRASAAHNRYIGIETLTEEELDELKVRCQTRAMRDASPLEEAADTAECLANRKAEHAKARASGLAP